MNGQSESDYRRKYKNLKHKLKFLVYEQECFQEELRKAQRKLLKISRDKSFLLDRLLQYENVDEDSSDSDETASSENSEGEVPKLLDTPSMKKKRSPQLGGSDSPSPSSLSLPPSLGYPHSQTPTPASAQSPYLSTMTSPTFSQFPSEYLSSYPSTPGPPGSGGGAGGAAAAAVGAGGPGAKSEKIRREKRTKGQKGKKSKLRVPLHSGHPDSVSMTFSSASDPLSALSSKLPPTTILSSVPQQMFSDAGAGSDDDAMEGDDDLVIDIPE